MYASYAFNLIESNSTMSYRLAEEALKTDKNNKAAYRAILNSYYSGAFYSVIAEFDNELNCLKISPDNNHIITVPFRSDNIQIWDTTGNMINDFISNEGSTSEIEFLLDSLMFFTCPSTSIFDFHGNLIKQYPGHGNTDLLSVSKGNLIASFSNEYIELWNIEGKEIIKIPVEKYVTNIALSPDNSYLSYTFMSDPVIRLINLKNNKKTKLYGHKDNLKHMNYKDIVTSLNFSQDSKLLLSSCLDSTCILWNIEGKPLLTLKSLETPATFAAISPNIEKIAIAGYGGKVDIYSISGIIQKSFNTNQYWIDDIRFSNDDKIYTTCTDCSEILLWDISEKKSETIKSHSKRINNIDYSPDGKYFVTASFDSTAILYNAKGGELQHLTGHKDKINSAQFAGNSKLIVTASNDHYVIVWDLKGEKLLQYQFDKYPVEFASFSPDNKHIILISPANIVRIIDLDGRIISDFQWLYDYSWNVGGSWWPRSTLLDTLGREINYKEWHNSFVNSAELSPDSKYVLTASNDSTARLWDTQGKEILRFNGHNDRVIDASFSGSGEKIVTIGLDNSIRLWDINGDLLEVFGGYNETPRYAIFSYDDGYITTQSLDDTTRWYDMDGNMLEKDFWNRECYISSSFFSPSGKQILTASRDGTAKLWNLNSKQNIELGESYYASFSPYDEYIVTINWNEITIWDYFGNKINSFVASEDMVNTVEFSADGSFLLSCSKDNTAILWDLKGNEIQSFTGNGNEVTSASFSPDGKYIIMTTDAKTIQKWLIDPDEIADIINKKTLSGHVWEMTAEAKIKYNVDLNHYEKGLEKAKNLKHDAHSTMDSIKKVDYLFEAVNEYEYIISTAKDILQQNEFLKVKKLCSDLYLELSIISIKTNDLIKALEYSEKGLSLQPSHRELPAYRAIALILNDRYNEAQKILKNLKGKPVKTGNEIYNEYILDIINSLEKENISHSDFLKVRTFLSDYFIACNNRSLALLYDGKFKEALFYAKKGYEIDSTEIIIYTKLALAYLLNEEYEKAEVIILKHRDEIVNNMLFKDYILEKLKELESKDITHPNFEKVRALLEK